MHLSNVRVENFRCLKEFELSLTAGLNVIVGRNNSGKSNLLSAIRHALGPSAFRGESLWLSEDDFFRSGPDAEPATSCRIELRFSDLSETQRAQFFEIVDFDLNEIGKSVAIIRFEATWPQGRKAPTIHRWGGPDASERTPIPAELIGALPVTFLPPLRDAEAALAPGHRNRFAPLLRDLAERGDVGEAEAIKSIFKEANAALEARPLVSGLRRALQVTTKAMAESDYAESTIQASPVDFQRILRTLRVAMKGEPVSDLSANGLGYNNLLYMAVVLEHLKSDATEESPLLLVEEPEAHLHPQLVVLLARYLAKNVPGARTPQTLVTSHSPVFASCVSPSQMRFMRRGQGPMDLQGSSLADAGLTEREEREVQRLLDVTRASLYFAKGVILVEGLTEVLLVPVLAERMGFDLAALHVSVIPLCGVAFGTLRKVIGPSALGIPTAIVTDGDPQIERGASWEQDEIAAVGDGFSVSPRVERLREVFQGRESVRLCVARVTLEYDLAEAGPANADLMLRAWSECFVGESGTFNSRRLAAAGDDLADRALCAWRGICRASHSASKAEFAHCLAGLLAGPQVDFAVPPYLAAAIGFVASGVAGENGEPERGGEA